MPDSHSHPRLRLQVEVAGTGQTLPLRIREVDIFGPSKENNEFSEHKGTYLTFYSRKGGGGWDYITILKLKVKTNMIFAVLWIPIQ